SDLVNGTALITDSAFHLNEFFQLMFHFFNHFGCGVQKHGCSASPKIIFIFMCYQSFDPHTSPVQYVDDPVQNGEVVVSSNFNGEILFHSTFDLGASNNISPTPAPVGTIGKTFSSFSTCTSSRYGPVCSSMSFNAFRSSG